MIYPDEPAASDIDTTGFTQPALFAFEYTLAELWRSWGVVPDAVLGHSVGEYVAAVLAGVMSLEDAARLIAARARLMQALPAGGAMAAVLADAATVEASLAHHPQVGIAALNAPNNTVISGEVAALERVLAALAAGGIEAQRLVVSHAFHSALVEPMLAPFEAEARRITFADPRLPIASNVTGAIATPGQLSTASYWRTHVRSSVRFADGVEALAQSGISVFLEVGPSNVLSALGRRCRPAGGDRFVTSLRRGFDDRMQLAEALAALHAEGVGIDWTAVHAREPRRRIALPPTPFDRARYWAPAAVTPEATTHTAAIAPLLDRGSELAPGGIDVYETRFTPARPAYVQDHRLYGVAIMPATAYVEMLLEAAGESLRTLPRLEEFAIDAPMQVDPAGTIVQVHVQREGAAASARIFSRNGSEGWRLHASARAVPASVASTEGPALAAVRERCPASVGVDEYYRGLTTLGIDYGPAFRGLAELWRGSGEAVGRIRLPLPDGAAAGYAVHPALLDAAFHVLGAAMPARDDDGMYVPVGAGAVDVWRLGLATMWCHAAVAPGSGEIANGDMTLFDEHGTLVGRIAGLVLKRARRDALAAALAKPVDSGPLPSRVAAGAAVALGG